MNALKEDKIPWKRGWRNSQPYNAVSNNNYHGVNNLLLSFIAYEKGYLDPRWCTFKQAKDNGWHINKGEKGTPIEFWSLYDSETKKKLSYTESNKLKNELSREDYQKRVHPLSETYTVFNAEQISGIPELAVEDNIVEIKSLIEKRDVLVKNMGVNFLQQGWEAYYSKDRDLLSLPPIEEFNGDYEYFSTLLHEAAHATGHESRLNRNFGNSFGSPEYAKEELRAEIAAAFTAQSLGIDSENQSQEHIENHKAYIQSWIEVLEKNPEELFLAIKEAEKISDYLIEKGEFEIAEIKQPEKEEGITPDQKLSKDISPDIKGLSILGYYTREDNTQFIHYKINEREYLTSGIVTWGKESQLKRISELTQVEQLPDIEQMKKNLAKNEPYGALNTYFQNREKQNDTIAEIKKFAQDHNVPIYTKMPEEFHINEGALTAPIGTQWIQDNGSILHKTIKRGLLLDENLAGLYEDGKRPKSGEKILSSKKHGLSNKNQNMSDSQRHNPILNTNNNVMKNIAANFVHQQQERKELIEQ